MSHATRDRAVLDAGLKALSVDSGLPVPWRLPGVAYVGASDEHGKLALAATPGGGNRGLKVGDKLRLVPGHVDPTVNMYDWYVCIRDGRVEALWPIAGRGQLL